MRRILLFEYLTLDGVIDDPPEWIAPYRSDDLTAYLRREMRHVGALMLGRSTWEAAASQGRMDAWCVDAAVGTMPTYVVSTTIPEAVAGPGVHLLRDITAVAELRDGDGPDILVHGSCQLARSLIRANLIDEYRLLTFPVVRGSGQRLFEDGHVPDSLILTARESFPNGVTAHVSSPAEDEVFSLDLPMAV
jgi:dihydrofolate reductase